MFRRLALTLGLVIAAAGSVGTITTTAYAGGLAGGVISTCSGPVCRAP